MSFLPEFPRQLAQQARDALWALRHASLCRRIDRGSVAARVQYGWLQVPPALALDRPTCHGQVWIYGRAAWRIEFDRYLVPVGGVLAAEVVFAEPVAWPVLVRTREALILPRALPTPAGA